ncbi:MAG TPA: hypothetical protein VEC57_05815 [Candidatus Limnocylindrales bacterium]|nr:hypothetical protein [Candidatus Limnocylindrales bacterium]
MAGPIIRCTDAVFPRFSAPDLDVMETFLLAFGMQRAARTDTALYMRGTDSRHHVHVTHLGPAAFVGMAFEAASAADLERLAAATGRPVEALGEPGGGDVVRLQDPDGRRVDVVFGIEAAPPLPLRAHPPMNTGSERVRIGELQRVSPGPSQVKRFGHAAIKTADLPRLAAWYHEHLGLLTSDDIFVEGPDQPIGRFLRCDCGDRPVDHHTLLILETGESRLGHAAWEIADFDDLMVGHEHLKMTGQGRHYWGIGRHVLGGQIFDYWKDPLGFTVEHWTDSDLLPAAAAPASHHLLNALSQWGPQPPPDLDF